jgi:hypothetical protein
MKLKHFDNFGCRFLACGLLMTLLTVSCHKHSSAGDDSICVTRLDPQVSDYNVSGADLDSIYNLFKINNLSTANLQFQYWITYTEVNVDPGAYNGYEEQIQANQFFNGLPVFADMKIFIFYDGNYSDSGSVSGYSGPAPNADTTTHQTFAGLRTAFLAHLSQSYTEGGASAYSKPFIPSPSTYTNACLNVTLGYLDARTLPANAPNVTSSLNQALVKVWSVTPARNSSITYYPLVYVEDDNGFAWGVPFFVP